MIAREERLWLHRVLSSFSRGELPARDLVRRLEDFLESGDEAVDDIAFKFLMRHEDDESVVLRVSREEWNSLQRSLLFLESVLDIEWPASAPVGYRWGWTHGVALAGLLASGVSLCLGASYWEKTFAVLAALAIACRLLAGRFGPPPPNSRVPYERLYPFASPGQLLSERRRNAGFRKQPYPVAIAARWRAQQVSARRRRRHFDGISLRLRLARRSAVFVHSRQRRGRGA